MQGFPDEFHLGTLEALLGAVPQLQTGVRLAGIMASLMDRLARFVAGGDPAVRRQLDEADAFGRLKAAAGKVGFGSKDLVSSGFPVVASSVVRRQLDEADAVGSLKADAGKVRGRWQKVL